ncbi:hypothetical protein ACQPXB_23105 [Amycolatopsis sp. CA-161197]|jgi:hypothetical protein|uniref:hypothetical protein n=1 Tax=unclassified Amycolatopsis TaxID=2618356 RepID=UPI00345623CC
MPEPLSRWGLQLFGCPCSVCGRPAERLWFLADSRVVSHPGGGPLCRLANPQADEDVSAPADPRGMSAA